MTPDEWTGPKRRTDWLRNLSPNHILPEDKSLHEASETRARQKITQPNESACPPPWQNCCLGRGQFLPLPECPCWQTSTTMSLWLVHLTHVSVPSDIKRLQHRLSQTERSRSGFELLAPDDVTEGKMGLKICTVTSGRTGHCPASPRSFPLPLSPLSSATDGSRSLARTSQVLIH